MVAECLMSRFSDDHAIHIYLSFSEVRIIIRLAISGGLAKEITKNET
jgi:hypothetical protein